MDAAHGCLRIFSEYKPWNTEQFQQDHAGRRWNAFGYIDARDGAQAVRKGLEARITGHQVYIIANADTCFDTPSDRLAQEQFANVPLDSSAVKASDPQGSFSGNETLLSCAKARRDLDYTPQWSWRNGGETPWRSS
jgi:nucleoside-diphosphate-sugar epimerase